MLGSPPPCRAAMMIARLSLLHSLPRLASMAPFLCLIVAQCEWPDMAPPSSRCVVVCVRDRLPLFHHPDLFLDLPEALGLRPARPRLVQAQRLLPGCHRPVRLL